MNDCASYLVSNISDMTPSWCSVTRSPPSLQQLEQGESHMGNASRSKAPPTYTSAGSCGVLTLRFPAQGPVQGLHNPV